MQKPSLEMIIIGVILLLFSAFALNKCNQRKVAYQQNQPQVKTSSAQTSSTGDLYDDRARRDTLTARSPIVTSPTPSNVPTTYDAPLRPARTPEIDPISAAPAVIPTTIPDAAPELTPRPTRRPTKAVPDDTPEEDNNIVTRVTPRLVKKGAPLPEPEEEAEGVSAIGVGGARLYVSISGLKVRTAPNLTAKVVQKLALFDEVSYQNEVTKYTQPLSLGKEMANEPWVKVRTKKGKIGWVYGAGVSYYKIKRKGVM
jgi:Bacterial SH3 domain